VKSITKDCLNSLEKAKPLNEALIDTVDTDTKPKRFKDMQELRDYEKTNPYGFVSNSKSLCPKCNAPLGTIYGYNMKHKGMQFDDDGWLLIPWKCRKCGAVGDACFSTEFWSQSVQTPEGMVEVKSCGIEPDEWE